LDFVAVYSDTLTNEQWTGTDGYDREHRPLNLKITQRSYSWRANYAQDFIMIDYDIANEGSADLRDVYLGIYVDAEAGHISRYISCYLDDLCGFRETYPSRAGHGYLDTINLAYIMDDDGDPNLNGVYDAASVQSATGVRILRKPDENLKVSFNWWVSNTSPSFDWGPMRESSKRDYGTGGQGTPVGNRNKYYLMANGEHDYDQIYAARSYFDEGWLPPNPAVANQLARGGDTRFVLSMGPFNLPASSSLPFTIAYVGGERFHRSPDYFDQYMNNDYMPDEFYNTFDFRDLAENAVWASWVYDNPGVDTDGDGDAGPFWEIEDTLVNGRIVLDSFYYAGDGVPDFRAASAPPPPIIRVTTEQEIVQLRWNGLVTESVVDPFTKKRDFEGYRVYMGRLNRLDKLAMIASHDFVDFTRYYWNDEFEMWETAESPLKLDSLQLLYGEDFDPIQFPCAESGYGFNDGVRTACFEPVDWNQSIEGWIDGGAGKGRTMIRKVFLEQILAGEITPLIDVEDTLTSPNWFRDLDPTTGDSAYYHKFYEYECVIDNLLPSVPWYFAVTAFDFGDSFYKLEELESSPLANSVEAWPINDAVSVLERGLQVRTYPNPYYGDGRYAAAGYEDPQKSGFVDHERRIHFLNLPPRCTVRIYTLDGDLVRTLDHPGSYTSADSKLQWNLRSKNNELVASGIYLYVVESEWGKQIGKIIVVL